MENTKMLGFDNRNTREPAEVDVSASMETGVWLVDDDVDHRDTPFLIVMARDVIGAAQAYAAYVKTVRGVSYMRPASKYAVFPLKTERPRVFDVSRADTDQTLAFQDCFIGVRL